MTALEDIMKQSDVCTYQSRFELSKDTQKLFWIKSIRKQRGWGAGGHHKNWCINSTLNMSKKKKKANHPWITINKELGLIQK